jgi:hypothetical protein
MKRLVTLAAAITTASALVVHAEQSASITVHVDKPGIKVSPTLYGIFFEAIGRADDGGLYGEMLQNRSFEDRNFIVAWTLVKGAGAEASMSLDKSQPLNKFNPTSLKLEIKKADNSRVGISNEGFKGCPYPVNRDETKWVSDFEKAARESKVGLTVRKDREYIISLYARGGGEFKGPLTVSIEKQDGTVIASRNIDGITGEWKKFECRLTANSDDNNARFVVASCKNGTVWLDMVSMFPKDTFKERPNGVRADLAQMLLDMKPAFVRFPGGCFVEGDELVYASRWKETIGDVAERPGHWNRWGYHSSEGLGYHEYLQLCEDLNAEPLFVINCGMAHRDHVPMDQMGPWVQDALDAIEYANGPADSKWG